MVLPPTMFDLVQAATRTTNCPDREQQPSLQAPGSTHLAASLFTESGPY